MEGLNRLVSESLARYGLDRPVDYRRLQWSRWFRCESLHSLLHVPSKPGIFAIAEEVAAFVGASEDREGQDLSRALSIDSVPALAAEAQRRMLSVLQFREDDDMAYVLDRMLTRQNPMSARMASGRCYVRFVVINDAIQRSNICSALNQWLASTAEKVSGIGAHFASSLELNSISDRGMVTPGASPAAVGSTTSLRKSHCEADTKATPAVVALRTAVDLNSGFAATVHCPLPSGF